MHSVNGGLSGLEFEAFQRCEAARGLCVPSSRLRYLRITGAWSGHQRPALACCRCLRRELGRNLAGILVDCPKPAVDSLLVASDAKPARWQQRKRHAVSTGLGYQSGWGHDVVSSSSDARFARCRACRSAGVSASGLRGRPRGRGAGGGVTDSAGAGTDSPAGGAFAVTLS